MGMAATQARLLSITARLTDNENSGQAISYEKIRLSDKTDQVSKEYLEALNATKLTVLTGFNGSDEIYTDISYSLMTGYNTVACGAQYVVTNSKGEVLVTQKQAAAFEAGNGDLNVFLYNMGYSQSDITVKAATATDEEKEAAEQQIHEAWDKYLTSVGLSVEDEEHGLDFGWVSFSSTPYDGYATYTVTDSETGEEETRPLNYEGTTQEQRELYDYAVSLTEAYYGTSDSSSSLKTAADPDNTGYITYLTNLFQKMASSGYYTEDDESKTIKDNTWFEQQLRDGTLLLEVYSASEKGFVSTSIDSDEAIEEVTDERAIAIAEQEYEIAMSELEAKDSKYDLELKKLDTEHSALQTEYDAIKGLVDKNIEKSFNAFS